MITKEIIQGIKLLGYIGMLLGILGASITFTVFLHSTNTALSAILLITLILQVWYAYFNYWATKQLSAFYAGTISKTS